MTVDKSELTLPEPRRLRDRGAEIAATKFNADQIS